jgi:hypothetical protein
VQRFSTGFSCLQMSTVLISATKRLLSFERKEFLQFATGNSHVFYIDVFIRIRPDFAIMEIGRECWPLFPAFDVRSI